MRKRLAVILGALCIAAGILASCGQGSGGQGGAGASAQAASEAAAADESAKAAEESKKAEDAAKAEESKKAAEDAKKAEESSKAAEESSKAAEESSKAAEEEEQIQALKGAAQELESDLAEVWGSDCEVAVNPDRKMIIMTLFREDLTAESLQTISLEDWTKVRDKMADMGSYYYKGLEGFGVKGGHLGLELADYNKRGTAYFKMVDGKVQYDVQDQLRAQGFMRGSATGSDAAKAQ